MNALGLIFTASPSHARLGWTLTQFEQQYGKPVSNQEEIAGRIGYLFKGGDYIIAAFFLNKQVSRTIYFCPSDSMFDWARARALLGANAPDAIWADFTKNEAQNSYLTNGTKDGVEAYYASLTEDGRVLGIWTKEEDEAGRTMPNLDTSLLANVFGSIEKGTSEITTGPATSIDSDATSIANHAEEQANATSLPPSQRPDSPHASHDKISKRHRKSLHSRYVDVKTRLIALWHQSLRHANTRDGLYSNSKNGERKKVGFAIETRD